MLKKSTKCPMCGQPSENDKKVRFNLNDTNVTDSRVTKNGVMIRRRRKCNCGNRFTTYEKIDKPQLNVMKNNGQILPFDKDRLYNSIKTALNGCIDEIKKSDEISEEIYEKVQKLGQDAVSTKKIGDLILKSLKKRDKIGYVRFYGVFKKVSDPKDYKKIVDTLH